MRGKRTIAPAQRRNDARSQCAGDLCQGGGGKELLGRSTRAQEAGLDMSRHIAELEEQLGVRLLERSTRSLRLTDVGTEMLEHARDSAELCEAVDSVISNRLSDVSGTVRLCAPQHF